MKTIDRVLRIIYEYFPELINYGGFFGEFGADGMDLISCRFGDHVTLDTGVMKIQAENVLPWVP